MADPLADIKARRAAARTVTTPETRRVFDKLVVNGVGDLVGYTTRAELPTLDAPVDRGAAIAQLTAAISSGALADAHVLELLAIAERLKRAA